MLALRPKNNFGSLAETLSSLPGVLLPNPARYRSGRKVSEVSGLQDLKVIALDSAIRHFPVHKPVRRLEHFYEWHRRLLARKKGSGTNSQMARRVLRTIGT